MRPSRHGPTKGKITANPEIHDRPKRHKEHDNPNELIDKGLDKNRHEINPRAKPIGIQFVCPTADNATNPCQQRLNANNGQRRPRLQPLHRQDEHPRKQAAKHEPRQERRIPSSTHLPLRQQIKNVGDTGNGIIAKGGRYSNRPKDDHRTEIFQNRRKADQNRIRVGSHRTSLSYAVAIHPGLSSPSSHSIT